MKLKYCLWIFLTVSILGCNQKTNEKEAKQRTAATVVNFDNKSEFEKFRALNLDSVCANLLDPRNTTESERETIINSWTDFHKKVTEYLTEENFSWEIPDSTISIYNRIYFHEDGSVNYYVFNINNQAVSEEKKAEFQKVLMKFSEEIQIDLERNEPFAQCGKTRYINY